MASAKIKSAKWVHAKTALHENVLALIAEAQEATAAAVVNDLVAAAVDSAAAANAPVAAVAVLADPGQTHLHQQDLANHQDKGPQQVPDQHLQDLDHLIELRKEKAETPLSHAKKLAAKYYLNGVGNILPPTPFCQAHKH